MFFFKTKSRLGVRGCSFAVKWKISNKYKTDYKYKPNTIWNICYVHLKFPYRLLFSNPMLYPLAHCKFHMFYHGMCQRAWDIRHLFPNEKRIHSYRQFLVELGRPTLQKINRK